MNQIQIKGISFFDAIKANKRNSILLVLAVFLIFVAVLHVFALAFGAYYGIGLEFGAGTLVLLIFFAL